MKIFRNILETIGNTPLVKIEKLNEGVAEIVAKVESFNPAGSVKDRVALEMIEEAERSGKLVKGATIIEPTSGNTGIGLAIASAVKGYQLILTMPETMSEERKKLLSAYGAKLVLTDGALGMKGSIEKAKLLLNEYPNSFMPMQFENESNPAAHRKTTAEEIWKDCDGKVDIFVAGVGTGGTLTGCGERLKELNGNIKIVAVEPFDSAVLSGGKAAPHKIQGIGAGFVPKVLNTEIIDEIFCVKYEDAVSTLKSAAVKEGLLVGISSGAALFAALELSKRSENRDKRIVVLLPDSAERYLSSNVF